MKVVRYSVSRVSSLLTEVRVNCTFLICEAATPLLYKDYSLLSILVIALNFGAFQITRVSNYFMRLHGYPKNIDKLEPGYKRPYWWGGVVNLF